MIDAKLITLIAVVEKGNFTKAAEFLSLTQPAISHHINLLEQELSTKLVIRNKNEVKLTPEGEIVLKYAKRIQAMYDEMNSKVKDAGKHLEKLRIGITHTSESNTITEVLAKYGTYNHSVSITIITDTAVKLKNMLENYEIDMAVLNGMVTSPNIRYLNMGTDDLVCVLNNDNPLAKESIIRLEDLKKEPLILRLPSSATRQLFEASLTTINESIDDFNVTVEVDNISTIKDLIKKDLGVSILPMSSCIDDIIRNKLTSRPVEKLKMTRNTYLAYTDDFTHPEIFEDILSIYKQTLKKQ